MSRFVLCFWRCPGRFARVSLLPTALLALVVLTALLPGESFAQSRRERDIEALKTRMTVAEARYRQALVAVGNNDPTGMTESNAALEDMEDALTACMKLKGCPLSQLLATYKRLLKSDVDARASAADGEDGQDFVDTELPTGNVPRSAEAAALLSPDGQRFVNMVQMNPAVQAGIRRWLTDMRVSLIQSHENYQYMRHLMSPAFQRNGLPEALLFGIMAKESNGRVHSGSRVGAVGPLQFMPSTGRRFGLGPDGTGFDTRYDPRASADAAAAYLNERYAELGNNIEMWLAAYNGGEGRALRVHRSSGGRSFWDETVYNQFPAETKDYVPMVIAAAWLYLHPKEYGLEFPKLDARPASIRLERSATIYELTICLGNGGTRDGFMRVLRNLNPRYEADSWIAAGTHLNATMKIAGLYARHCQQGARADLARQLVASDPRSAIVRVGPIEPVEGDVDADADAQDTGGGVTTQAGKPERKAAVVDKPKRKPTRQHRVERGDTLMSIARKYDCSIGDLAKANALKAPRYSVRLGQRIKLEGCGG
ncbi:MAG: LysM peptidoglycan-binding domain-containing protein [Lysobacteraceae bacterium]|nr:MAG: LysM peptidoglycan-binding domain-containing protein [Xanthomonadaceae bacterium]